MVLKSWGPCIFLVLDLVSLISIIHQILKWSNIFNGHLQASRNVYFLASCAEFPSSRADLPSVWDGFPYVSLFSPPNYIISLQGASRFAHFFTGLVIWALSLNILWSLTKFWAQFARGLTLFRSLHLYNILKGWIASLILAHIFSKETYKGQQIVMLHILLVPINFCANIGFIPLQKRDERITGTKVANLPWSSCCPSNSDSFPRAENSAWIALPSHKICRCIRSILEVSIQGSNFTKATEAIVCPFGVWPWCP